MEFQTHKLLILVTILHLPSPFEWQRLNVLHRSVSVVPAFYLLVLLHLVFVDNVIHTVVTSLLSFARPRLVMTETGLRTYKSLVKSGEIVDADLLVAQEEDDLQEGVLELPQRQEEEVVSPHPLERCKFWPQCKNGDRCSFHHPTTPCKCVFMCERSSPVLNWHMHIRMLCMCTSISKHFFKNSKRFTNAPKAKKQVVSTQYVYPSTYFLCGSEVLNPLEWT